MTGSQSVRRAFRRAALKLWLILTLAPPLFPQTAPLRVVLSEKPLRKLATRQTLPAYPRLSLNQGIEGVAVAEIVVDTRGLVSEVRMLQSPDRETARSVQEAVKQWTFMPQTVRGAPISIRSKLTFYFVRRKGQVLHPDEMTRETNEARN